MSRHTTQGFQLLEVLVVLAVTGIVVSIGAPALLRASRRLRLRMAGDEVASALEAARVYAARHSSNVAVRFQTRAGSTTFTLYADGNGNGVHTVEIRKGTDPRVEPPRRLAHLGSNVRFGFPPNVVPTDPSNPYASLGRLNDPIRFNRSDLASFNGRGTATPGSVYLTDGSHLLVVRVLNRTGRIRILEYDRSDRRWH